MVATESDPTEYPNGVPTSYQGYAAAASGNVDPNDPKPKPPAVLVEKPPKPIDAKPAEWVMVVGAGAGVLPYYWDKANGITTYAPSDIADDFKDIEAGASGDFRAGIPIVNAQGYPADDPSGPDVPKTKANDFSVRKYWSADQNGAKGIVIWVSLVVVSAFTLVAPWFDSKLMQILCFAVTGAFALCACSALYLVNQVSPIPNPILNYMSYVLSHTVHNA